jgi:hypothetical protein
LFEPLKELEALVSFVFLTFRRISEVFGCSGAQNLMEELEGYVF